MAVTTSASYLDPTTVIQVLDLAPGQKVADFGVGGAGAFAIALSQRVGNDGAVVMFDVKKAALSAALSMLKLRGATNGQAVWTNLEIYGGASGITDNTFDAGLLINVLNESTKSKDILAEAGRMVKSGGKVLVVDWKPDVELSIAPNTKRRLAAGQVAQIGKSLGLAELKQFEAGPYHWGLVLVKT